MGCGTQLDKYMTYEACEAGAHIRVQADAPADKAVPERLFGLFTEHLGKNVYGGAWAQVLPNPGFELFDAVLADVPESHRKDVTGATDKRLRKAAGQFAMPALPDYRQLGLAPYWAPAPVGKGTYRLVEGLNGTAQQITAGDAGYCGIETPVFLPLHRTERYQFQAHVLIPDHTVPMPDFIKLQVWQISAEEGAGIPPTVDPPDAAPYGLDASGALTGTAHERLLADTKIGLNMPNISVGQWSKVRAIFTVTGAGVPLGARLKLRLLIPAQTAIVLDQALFSPTDAIEGWDPDVVQLLRDMRLSVLRFPGGNFASAYHWQDGIGPIELRPEKPNPAWAEWEPNHVGTNEWLTLCELVGAEPMICVNAGNGEPKEAVEWIHYCNDPASTEWGKRRAADGHPAPYNVRLWEVGNELWGSFQVGWCRSEEYGSRFGAFAEAMKKADPSIQLIAVGGSQPQTLMASAQNDHLLGAAFAGQALERHGEHVWAIAEHAVMGGARTKNASAHDTYMALLSHTHHIGGLNEKNRQVFEKLGLSTLIAQTEQMVAVRGVNRPTDESLAAAVVWAGFMNWFMRSNGLVSLFTRSALINHGDLLAKVREVVYPLPGYHAQALYARQPGRIPTPVHVTTPVISVDDHAFKAAELPCIDVVSLLSPDGDNLSVLITNRGAAGVVETVVEANGFVHADTALVTTIAGPSFASHNTWYATEHVAPFTYDVHAREGLFTLSLPPHSVTLLALRRA